VGHVPSAIWSGNISFGLVTVPVKLVSAVRSKDVRFNQLEEGTGARIRYRRVSEATGEEVPQERIVRGSEIAPGQYVVVGQDELDKLRPKASHTIDIQDFVELEQIDPIHFEQPYYLVPDRNAAKPYKLLLDAMTDLQRVALGKVVLRGKEHLVAIRPLDGALCVETMRYADEVIPVDSLDGLPDEEVAPTQRELDMAQQLIEALAGDFEPEKYHDEYREQVNDLIEKKAAGEEIVAEPMVEEPAKVVDLMAALEQSLARAGKGESRRAAARKPAKAAAKKTKKAGAKKASRSRKSA
jgi:DNA end-binding protein Ku